MDKEITPRMLQRITAEYNPTPEIRYAVEVSLDGTILFSTPVKEGQWKTDPWETENLIRYKAGKLFMKYKDVGGTPAPGSYHWKMCFYIEDGLIREMEGWQGENQKRFCEFEDFLGVLEKLTGENFGAFPSKKLERLRNGEERLAVIRKRTEENRDWETSQTDDAIFCFAQKLMSNTVKVENKKNVLISPISIGVVFCLLACASRGKSREDLLQWMNADFKDVQEIGRVFKNIVSEDTVSMANAMYVKPEIMLHVFPDFIKASEKFAATDILSADVDVARVINEWAEEKTHGMISKIVSEDNKIDDLALLNAISFEASWADVYDDSDVFEGTFQNMDGVVEKANYLCSTEDCVIYDDSVIGFLKPYEDYGFNFMGLLPRQTRNPGKWLAELPDGALGEYIRGAVSTRIKVKLPEFSFDDMVDLKKMLKTGGVRSVFDPKTADLSGMLSIPESYISGITHKTHIELDRAGTRAAGVTMMAAAAGCIPTQPYFEVKFDRPFIFGIVHEKTGLPLFLGIVNTLGG